MKQLAQLNVSTWGKLLFPRVENLPQMPCGELQEMVCSSPAGAAGYWHNSPAAAPGLWCYTGKVCAAPPLSPDALMYCQSRVTSNKVI